MVTTSFYFNFTCGNFTAGNGSIFSSKPEIRKEIIRKLEVHTERFLCKIVFKDKTNIKNASQELLLNFALLKHI